MAGNIGTSSMPTTYKSWANGYKSIIETAYEKSGPDYRSGVFFMENTSNQDDRDVEVGGIDAFARWDDGDRATQTEVQEGYEKRYSQVRYGEEVPIGILMRKFQGKNIKITKRAAKQLGTEGYLTEQKSAYSLLGYGFADTNTYLTGLNGSTESALLPDGKRLFSTLHPCSPINSTTYSNALSDNAAVGEAALKAMIENLDGQLDDKGRRLHLGQGGYTWIVPLQEYPEALRVVGSEKRSGTTDNDMNVYKGAFDGQPIEVRWVPWLREWSTTAHFLCAKEATERFMPLTCYTSENFYTDDYVDDSTDTAYVRGRCMFDVGSPTGRGVVGSQGTGTGTYSD